jgi:serine/threonine-protein kinase
MRLDEAMARTADQVVHFDVASDGSLVFLPEGSAAPVPQPLTWIDRTGRSERAHVDPNSYVGVSTSPNGTRLALAIREQAGSDIWIADPSRGTMTQLTASPAADTDPVWTPDGGAVIFQSDAAGRELFMRDAQSAGPAVQLTHTGGTVRGRHATTRAGTIIFSTGNAILERTAAGETRILFESPAQLLSPQPSADGRWLAYESDESGRLDVYVRALAPPAAVQRVSSGGGSSPRWSDDGRELFYLGAEGLMSVPVRSAGPDLPAATRLFAFAALGSRPVDFDLARDGKRFVFILEGARPADARQSLVVVRNWSDQLGALLTRSPAAPVATP